MNVTSSAQTVTATFTLTGPADGTIVEADLLLPGGGVVDYAMTDSLTQTSGTPGNGTFTAQFGIPQNAPAGNYPIIVYLSNPLATDLITYASAALVTSMSPVTTWYQYADIPSGSESIPVTNSGTQPTPPTLSGFSATASVNVTSAAANITLSAVLADTHGAVDGATVTWNDPAGLVPSGSVDLNLTSGTTSNGTWTGSIPVQARTAPDRLNLTVQTWNTIGQSNVYGYQFWSDGLEDKYNGILQPIPGASTYVTIINTDLLAILPPQVTALAISPNPATFGSNGQVTVTITATVTDTLSSPNGVTVYFPDSPTAPAVTLNQTVGTTYGAVMTCNRSDFLPGTYASFVNTTDLIGNTGLFTPNVPGIASLTLNPEAGGFDAWIASYGITSYPDNDPASVLQPDGLTSLIKYAFNMDPTQSETGSALYMTPATGTSGMPYISTTGSGTNLRLRVEYIQRVSSPSTTYAVEFSSDPGGGWAAATAQPTITAINSQWQRVVVEDAAGIGMQHRFGRMSVTFTP